MNGSKLKICQVLHGIVGGGSEQVVLNYAEGLRDDFEFEVLYQYEPNAEMLSRFEKLCINCIHIPDKVHHPLGHIVSMYKQMKWGQYHAVHSHQDWFLNFYVMFLAWLAGIKIRVAHHHKAYHEKLPLKPLVWFLQGLNKIFATTYMACGEQAAISGWGKRCKNVVVLPNGINTERFKFNQQNRDEIRTQYGIGDKFCVGHLGRFYPQKNHDFLLDVFAAFHKDHPDSVLLLVGDGPLKKQMEEKASLLGIAENCIFAGLQKEPEKFYSAMDAFCFPSLWEGVPLTLLEAQYNGVPIVVSENVTDEVKIDNRVNTASINNKNEWVSILLNINGNERTNQILSNPKKYDIRETAKTLKDVYSKMK